MKCENNWTHGGLSQEKLINILDIVRIGFAKIVVWVISYKNALKFAIGSLK